MSYGGNYVNLKDVGVEIVLVTVFPFGAGDPEMKRRNKVSRKESLKNYLRTSLPNFQRDDTVWIMYHIFSKILSYETGIMIGRSNYGSTPLTERLAGMTTQYIKSASKENSTSFTDKLKLLTKALSTSCRALVHTPEADKTPHRKSFAMLEHYRLNSLFLTASSCDECSFCVCFYTKPQGVLGDVLAFIGAHKERSRRTLHSHWQVVSKQLLMETQNLLFTEDKYEKPEARKNHCSRRSSHGFILWC